MIRATSSLIPRGRALHCAAFLVGLYASAEVHGLDTLVPAPRESERREGEYELSSARVHVPEEWSGLFERYSWLLVETLRRRNGPPLQVAASAERADLRIVRRAGNPMPADGYELIIDAQGVELVAAEAAGVFNGLATLAQLIEAAPAGSPRLSSCRIRDWPAISTRAVHLDMTCQQFTADYIQRLMRTLARYKVNAILMEYSGMFPFRNRRGIARPDAFTEDELRSILATAEQCNQEVIPHLQSAGHLEYVLTVDPEGEKLSRRHGGYTRPLAEGGYAYCLALPESTRFATALVDEMLEQHPGLKRLHLGGDEVNAAACELCSARDFRSLYFEHYRQLGDHCRKKGVQPMIWVDVAVPFRIRKDPAALRESVRAMAQKLPRVFVGIDWWYDGERYEVAPELKAAGFPAFTASAARSGKRENFSLSRLRHHLSNVRAAALQAVRSGAEGTLITSWSYRSLPHEVCIPTYACGAAYAWNPQEEGYESLLNRVWRQRYGLEYEASLALTRAALAETDNRFQVPTLATVRPRWDPATRAWIISAVEQARQLARCVEEDGRTNLKQSLREHLREFGAGESAWRTALAGCARRTEEFEAWRLSREHVVLRLELCLALLGALEGQSASPEVARMLKTNAFQRDRWARYYDERFTRDFLIIDLTKRFDAVDQIVAEWRPLAVHPDSERD